MTTISDFFQREDAIAVMEDILPDPVKRQQVIQIQILIAEGKIDEATRLTNELDPETCVTCVNVAASLLVGMAIANMLNS